MDILSKVFQRRAIDWRAAIKTGTVAMLALYTGQTFSHLMHRPDSLISGMWTTMAAIVVLQSHLGGTYKAAWQRFLGILVGSLIGALCTVYLGSDPVALGFSIVGTLVACSFLNISDSVRIACLSVSVVMVLWGLHPIISPWKFAFFRVIDSMLGISIAILVSNVLWPSQMIDKVRTNLSYIMESLAEFFSEDISFSNLQIRLYTLLYETKMNLEEAKIELLISPGKFEELQSLYNLVDDLAKQFLVLQDAQKPQPQKIYDSELKVNVDKLQSDIVNGLQNIEYALLKNQKTINMDFLTLSQEDLQKDLTRFRNTHATRKFSLLEVENFFVYLHTLDSIVHLLKLIENQIVLLYQEKTSE